MKHKTAFLFKKNSLEDGLRVTEARQGELKPGLAKPLGTLKTEIYDSRSCNFE